MTLLIAEAAAATVKSTKKTSQASLPRTPPDGCPLVPVKYTDLPAYFSPGNNLHTFLVSSTVVLMLLSQHTQAITSGFMAYTKGQKSETPK